MVAKQINVVEAFGLLLFRVGKGKEFHSSKLYVFKLTDFEDEDEEPKNRQFCKNHRVEKSKGKLRSQRESLEPKGREHLKEIFT